MAFLAQALGAQAWVPPKGEGYVSVGYQSSRMKYHYFGTDEVDRGTVESSSTTLAAGYSISDRFALSASIPYVTSSYSGSFPHPTEVDDGHEHSTFQDFRLEARYQALLRPLALTPFVGLVLPSHDYEYFAHSAAGRNLEEFNVGMTTGRSLAPLIDTGYFQFRAAYGFVEKVQGLRHDHVNADLELGYFLNQSWSFRLLGSWQTPHGGLEQPVPASSPYFAVHDQVGAEGYLKIGGGLAHEFSNGTAIYASYLTTIRGRDGHKLQDIVTVGVSRGFFRGPQRLPQGD